LLVNGVNFDVYGAEIRETYENKTFWGDFNISFWDCFDPPLEGYPQTLPAPEGHGPVPVESLGQYSTVIWVGNNYQGDLDAWFQTSILSYLESEGNILLMTRLGQDFITDPLKDYLGIDWAEQSMNTINNCQSTYDGLNSMTLTGIQSLNAVFDINLKDSESQLLFNESTSFGADRGIGVWKKPIKGGIYRENGGQFVFISGRPYRYNPIQLRQNIDYILNEFFKDNELTNIDESIFDRLPRQFELGQNYPNPFNPTTKINYELPITNDVDLSIYNTLGQKVATLVEKKQPAGRYQVSWNASEFASGVYYYRLSTGSGFIQIKKLVLLK
jgi:hypothetical protein